MQKRERPFQDHFSGHARQYAQFRPGYPPPLYLSLAECCERREMAWDCATGSGQAAAALAAYFDAVIATDASNKQIATAIECPNVTYRVAAAEHSNLPDATADLVTVAQALHWFDIDAFFAEARRVLKPGGVLAAWSYDQCNVSATIDPVLRQMLADVERFWPPEREIVANRYQGITPGLPALGLPQQKMTARWSIDQMLGYIRTWSATKRFLTSEGVDPVGIHETDLRRVWGDGIQRVEWPLTIKAWRR